MAELPESSQEIHLSYRIRAESVHLKAQADDLRTLSRSLQEQSADLRETSQRLRGQMENLYQKRAILLRQPHP